MFNAGSTLHPTGTPYIAHTTAFCTTRRPCIEHSTAFCTTRALAHTYANIVAHYAVHPTLTRVGSFQAGKCTIFDRLERNLAP